MLENEHVFAAAEAAISVVDEDRRGRRPGPDMGGMYTLEGAVAQELFRHLNSTFERDLQQAIAQARSEETGMRLGFIDLRDLEDYDPDKPETEENMPRSRAEKLQQLLTDAIEELKTLREHRCTFDSEDRCVTCGLDGRA